MKIPFAKKLSGTATAMHLAVYAALLWLILQATKHTDGFQVSTSPLIHSQMHADNVYSLCTWYTNTIITNYLGGMYSGGQDTPDNTTYKLYPIDLNTGIVRPTPLDIATEVRLYSVNRPQFNSSSPPIPTVGFYLTTAQYSVTFSESTEIGVFNNGELDMKYAIEGTRYSNVWFDTVIDKNGNPLAVVLSNPLNSDMTSGEVIPMTIPPTIPSIVPFGAILFPPPIPTSAGDITPPLSNIPEPVESTGGVSSAATVPSIGGLAWYWILLITVICIVVVLMVYKGMSKNPSGA